MSGSAVITFLCRCQECADSLFMEVPEDVKVVYGWIFPSSPLKSIHGKRQRDSRLPAEQTESQGSVPAIALYCWGVVVLDCAQGRASAHFSFLLVCFLFNMHSCQYPCDRCRPVRDTGTWIIFWIVRWFCDIPSAVPWAASVSVSTSDWWPVWQNNLSPSRGEAWLKRVHTHTNTHTLIQRLYKDWLGSREWGERGWCFRPHPELRNGRWCL